MRKKVFLGGTCNESTWRDELIQMLEIDYFNPVVEDWMEECMAEEIKQRETCDFVLYTITPKMTGTYAVAEVIDDSNKRPEKTIFCMLIEDGVRFTVGQVKSLTQVGKMVERNGGVFCLSLRTVANILNTKEIDEDTPDEEKGLYNKFDVYRTDGRSEPGEKHENCEYFVLDLNHDKYAKTALIAYQIACKDEYPELAKDLIKEINEANL